MAIFNNIIKSDGNSLVRKPTSTFAGVVGFPLTYAVLPYAQINNLVGWFNNGDGVTTATGVSAWVDRISGASLAQATGALQPTYTQQVNTLNGKNNISFAATQTLSAGDVFDIGLNTGHTICWYGKIKTLNTNRSVLGKSNQGASPLTVAGEYKITGGGTTTISAQFFDTALRTTATVSFDAANFFLYSLVIDRTANLLYLYINERAAASVTIAADLTTNYNNGSLFIQNNNNSGTLDSLEILVYQTALTQAEIAQNSIAMRGKYGQI